MCNVYIIYCMYYYKSNIYRIYRLIRRNVDSTFLGGVSEKQEFINYIMVCQKLSILLLSYSLNVYWSKQRTDKYKQLQANTCSSARIYFRYYLRSFLRGETAYWNTGPTKPHSFPGRTTMKRPGPIIIILVRFLPQTTLKKKLIFSRPPVDTILRNPAYNIFN